MWTVKTQNFIKIIRAIFEIWTKNIKNAPKMGVFPHLWPPKIFFQKSGSVTFVPLWCPNFMQNKTSIQWTPDVKFISATLKKFWSKMIFEQPKSKKFSGKKIWKTKFGEKFFWKEIFWGKKFANKKKKKKIVYTIINAFKILSVFSNCKTEIYLFKIAYLQY